MQQFNKLLMKAIKWNNLDDKLTSAHRSSWFWYPVSATVNNTYLNKFSIQWALSVTKLENSLNRILNWIILMKMSRRLLLFVCSSVFMQVFAHIYKEIFRLWSWFILVMPYTVYRSGNGLQRMNMWRRIVVSVQYT